MIVRLKPMISGALMAHTLSARKRIRQNATRADRNKPVRTRAANTVRDARLAIADFPESALESLRDALAALTPPRRRALLEAFDLGSIR